jgi:hypothetical protein
VTSLQTFLLNFYMHSSSLSHTPYILHWPHHPLFDHPDYVWCKVKIIKSSFQHPVLKHHKSVLFSYGETKFCINKRTRWAIYTECNTVACSHNVYTSSATLTAWYHLLKESALWWFNIAVNNKTYLGLHVKHSIFLPDFNQIWNFSTYFHVSPQYHMSPKSVQ